MGNELDLQVTMGEQILLDLHRVLAPESGIHTDHVCLCGSEAILPTKARTRHVIEPVHCCHYLFGALEALLRSDRVEYRSGLHLSFFSRCLLRLRVFKAHYRVVELPISSFFLGCVATMENRYIPPGSRISPRATTSSEEGKRELEKDILHGISILSLEDDSILSLCNLSLEKSS